MSAQAYGTSIERQVSLGAFDGEVQKDVQALQTVVCGDTGSAEAPHACIHLAVIRRVAKLKKRVRRLEAHDLRCRIDGGKANSRHKGIEVLMDEGAEGIR